MVRDEQRAAFARDVLEAFPLGAEPVAGTSGRRRMPGDAAQALAAAPRVDVAPPHQRVVAFGLRHRYEVGALRRRLDVEVVGLSQMDRRRLLVPLV